MRGSRQRERSGEIESASGTPPRTTTALSRAGWFLLVVAGPIAVVVGLSYATVSKGDDLDAARTAIALWGALALVSMALLVVIGWLLNGELFGAFIDSRNRYTLSRLQLGLWTILVISAWLAVVIVRYASGLGSQAIEVSIPGAVVATLGLAAGSFALSSGIKAQKKQRTTTASWRAEQQAALVRIASDVDGKTGEQANALRLLATGSTLDRPAEAALRATIDRTKAEIAVLASEAEKIQGIAAAEADAEGLLARRDSPASATPADIFSGEEVVNATTVDFGKVQMFYITIALVGAYGLLLFGWIGDTAQLFEPGVAASLPDLPESMVALLGLSHGGYLAVKAPNRTPSIKT